MKYREDIIINLCRDKTSNIVEEEPLKNSSFWAGERINWRYEGRRASDLCECGV